MRDGMECAMQQCHDAMQHALHDAMHMCAMQQCHDAMQNAMHMASTWSCRADRSAR